MKPTAVPLPAGTCRTEPSSIPGEIGLLEGVVVVDKKKSENVGSPNFTPRKTA
jgi:hypothetical protein